MMRKDRATGEGKCEKCGKWFPLEQAKRGLCARCQNQEKDEISFIGDKDARYNWE